MRWIGASLLVLAGCAAAPRAPATIVIPVAPVAEPIPQAPAGEAANDRDRTPDRDALLGTWLETLEGHQCRDTTTVHVRDGALDVSAKTCVGTAVYEMQSAAYADHALDVSFREASTGTTFQYHLFQASRRELRGEVRIGSGAEDEPRVYRVTWTKPR